MPIALHAGQLDRQVIIQAATVTRDASFGAQLLAWAETPAEQPEWAQVLESSTEPGGNPGAAASMAASARPTKVRIRWRSGITQTRHRVLHGARVLRITGIAELGRRRWLELACQEWAHEQ